MGILMIIFGLGFRRAFSDAGKKGIFASWLLILYGFGEGIGSGVFKADRIPIGFTFSGLFHDIVGGIGVTAILIFPLVMPGIFKSVKGKTYKVFSFLTFIISIASIILFLFRYSPDETDFLSVYKGLWQRIFMLSVYGYVVHNKQLRYLNR